MKVLVTGATGFIGKYLIEELLKNNYKVRILTRQTSYKNNNVEIFLGDITKKNSIVDAFHGVETVFHNAAYAMDWGRKSEIYKVNVEGTYNIANICREKEVPRVIFTSSAGIYGFPNSNEYIDEDYEKKPFNYYHKSKLESESILQKYSDLNVSIIRPCLVLGAGGNAVKILLKRIKQNKMRFIGNGKTHISLVHPIDVVQCLILALEKDRKNNIFNVVSVTCTINELLNEITNQLNIKPIHKHIPYFLAYLNAVFLEIFSKNEPSITRFRIKSFGTNRIISNEKAKRELGFKPDYNLYEIVKDMIACYKKFEK
jgi:nucleoside-diphosphate-sugar epimerase